MTENSIIPDEEIYGWHIIHAPTGLPYAFCQRLDGLTEDDVLDGLDPEEFVLVPLVRAGGLQ